MLDTDLQQALVDELKEYVFKDGVQFVKDGQLKPIHIYAQTLPDKVNEEEDQERDAEWNYVVVMLGDEDIVDGKWKVEIHFSIGIIDEGEDNQGNINIANMMNQIFLHMCKKGIIKDRYVMDTDEAYKRFEYGIEEPYYSGDLITYWRLPVPEMEMEVDMI
jgi:hypothetical protein